MALTKQQELFCREYVARKFNGADAYRAAYPKSKSTSAAPNAARLIAKDSVQARIAELTEKAAADAQISPAWALRRLKIEAEYTGEGASHSARVSAVGLAMKHLGMMTEDAPHPDRQIVDLKALTDDALDRLLSAVGPLLAPELRALGGAGEGAAAAAG